MTEPSVSPPKIEMPKFNVTGERIAKWLTVGVLIVAAVAALMFARRLIAPIDGFVTQQACATHGREVLSREVIESEASNRFSLIDRTEGHCVFGPIVEFDEDGEIVEPPPPIAADGDADEAAAGVSQPQAERIETIQISFADFEPGRMYQAYKIMFIALQLGAASAAVRFLGDPLLDRFVRRPSSPS